MDMLNKLCRACLTTKESFTYFLFENVMPETYWFCTSVKIDQNEKLPRALCNQCYDLLNRFYEFKTKCLQSQAVLQTYQNEKTLDSDIVLDPETESKLTSSSVKEEQILIDKYDEEESKCGNRSPSPAYDDEMQPDDCCDIIVKEVKTTKSRRKKLKKLKSEAKNALKSVRCKKLIYSCEHCNKIFADESRFLVHKLMHEGKAQKFHCQLCSKNFSTLSARRRHHSNVHIKIRLSGLRCSVCGQVSKSREALREHKRCHVTAGVACMCHVCGRNLASPLVLKEHLETHKSNRERLCTCEHCGKKFFTNKSLHAHISRQHTNRRYICAYCDYAFTDKHNLVKHINLHNNKKPYSCDICEKSFSVHSSLKEHKMIHSGERPFECVYCMKGFVSKRRLSDHLRIHTGEKPHKCSVCERRFTQRGTLLRHMKMHNKTAPVTCK